MSTTILMPRGFAGQGRDTHFHDFALRSEPRAYLLQFWRHPIGADACWQGGTIVPPVRTMNGETTMPRRSLKCLIFLIEARNQARLRDMQAQETLAQFQQRAFDASIERLKAENALKEYMEDSDPPPPPKRCAWSGCGV